MSGRDLLLEYAFPIEAIEPIATPSADYLKKVLVVVPRLDSSVSYDIITECSTKLEVEAITSSQCWRMLDAGMNSIYVLPSADLDIEAVILANPAIKYFTILIDPSFTSAHSALDVGAFPGVLGWATSTKANAQTFANKTRSTAFIIDSAATYPGANMFHAFGKMLSGRDWENQQYIEVPVSDNINSLTEAEDLFNKKISFCLTSEEYGNRLALFTNDGKAIVAPYIFEYFQLSMQGWGVQYIALNHPAYNLFEASLLEDFLLDKANKRFIDTKIVETIIIKIALVEDNFVANGDIVISEPKALWRVRGKLQQGII